MCFTEKVFPLWLYKSLKSENLLNCAVFWLNHFPSMLSGVHWMFQPHHCVQAPIFYIIRTCCFLVKIISMHSFLVEYCWSVWKIIINYITWKDVRAAGIWCGSYCWGDSSIVPYLLWLRGEQRQLCLCDRCCTWEGQQATLLWVLAPHTYHFIP